MKKFILEAGLISEDKLNKAIDEAEKTKAEIGKILVAQELISEKELIKIEAYLLGVPFINLEDETIPLEVLKTIPESIARAHNIVAFNKKERANYSSAGRVIYFIKFLILSPILIYQAIYQLLD